MKIKSLTKLVVTFILTFVGTSSYSNELKLGSDIPMADVKMRTTDDRQVSINDIAGEKGTVVAFWCNHCPYVVASRERFTNYVNDFKDKGISVIAINSNDPQIVAGDSLEKMKEFAKKYKYPYTYSIDQDAQIAKAFGAKKTPHIYLFDANKKLVYVGAIDDSVSNPKKVKEQYLKIATKELLAGKNITKSNSKAIGCSIKWPKK
ncbi:MAG: thioredoxin family protein [Lentisphaeria bacterium]|nr:thioredoxin family protein [Lentisphaeria bacterium]